ncbi:MAG: dodecin domain-containing protein [Acidobacteria bacterium]|nr:dodecin domain-containing protein [Acidobacteriota bacterium]
MERTYKKIEIVGVSEKSFADAVQNAVSKASKTIRNLDWFEVAEMRGLIVKGKVKEFQVTVKIGFRLEGQPA